MTATTTRTQRWGLDAEQLARHATVYAPDLLKDQVFLISGGGSGMGRATAFLAARLGAQVLICGRNEDKLRAAADDAQRLIGKRIDHHVLTIRDPDQVTQLMETAFSRYGRVDALVNSAGGQFPQDAIDYSIKGWLAVVDTNLNGTWYMMQQAARQWRDRGQRGSIVNIIANFSRGIPQSAHTAAARAGVAYLSKSVAVEWAPLDIRVNCIAPGTMETEGLDHYPPTIVERGGKGNPMRRRGDSWDIAEGVVYLTAASGKFITGEVLQIDGGMQCWGTNWPLGVPEHFRIDG